jgi:hypothetical protein
MRRRAISELCGLVRTQMEDPVCQPRKGPLLRIKSEDFKMATRRRKQKACFLK